jgi:hypothetical protein
VLIVYSIWIVPNIPSSSSFGVLPWGRPAKKIFAKRGAVLVNSRRNRDVYDEIEKDGTYYYNNDDYDADEYNRGRSRTDTNRQRSTSESRPYWEEEYDPDWEQTEEGEDNLTLETDVIEWEKCPTDAGTAWVLLPPASVQCPTAILHFCGGTFMGSAPHIWYRQLLHDLVRHTSCAVVATSIPVTLQSSPLNHIQLAKKIQRQFHVAYRNVLQDEYGDDLQQAPICGLGHSLGARLLVVLITLNPKHHFKSCILVSFTNFGAAAGIPGISQLYHQSVLAEKNRINEQQSMKSSQSKQRRRKEWSYNNDDDDDDDLILFLKELQDIVKEQTTKIQNALTPASNAFEFYPTPDQLWKAIRQDGRYTVNQTLVVQFDNDEVDQSSTLATAIKNYTSVKFARLRGTHLSPVSIGSSKNENLDNAPWLHQINSRVGRLLLKGLEGRKRARSERETLLELRQSIARYITEVVTKEL